MTKGAHNRAMVELVAGRDPVADRERARDLAARFESEAAYLRGRLAEIEWACGFECPACAGRQIHGGHERGCWLPAALDQPEMPS